MSYRLKKPWPDGRTHRVFGGAALIAVAIAWATVAGHASRVARASPIHALRCE